MPKQTSQRKVWISEQNWKQRKKISEHCVQLRWFKIEDNWYNYDASNYHHHYDYDNNNYDCDVMTMIVIIIITITIISVVWSNL